MGVHLSVDHRSTVSAEIPDTTMAFPYGSSVTLAQPVEALRRGLKGAGRCWHACISSSLVKGFVAGPSYKYMQR